VGTVAEFLSNVAVVQYDLIIVDLGLPDGDGLSAIRSLRSMGHTTAILIITARESVEDRVIGLDSGADDYLIKPFNHAELLARVRALLRRPPSEPQGPVFRYGEVELDEARGKITCSGKPIELQSSERRLLAMLMRRSDSVVPKSTIEDALSDGRELSTNAVEVFVSRLRKTLIERSTGLTIEAVRGIGYRLRLDGKP